MPKPRPPQTVWFRDEQRPRKPRLSQERIIQAAIELLDAEGVDGFSMRRLAARLDAGTMSLYAYVAAKEDVLDLALDAVMAEIEVEGTADAPWRAILTRQLVESRQVMRRHPWIPGLIGTRPLLGPTALARSELFYTALTRAGLDGPRLIAAVGALTFYVNGYVAAENVWRSWVGDPSQEAELRRQVQEHIAKHADLYPTLSQHAQLDNADFDGGFALGLKIILDGIEAQLVE
ncbi:MAG: TetR/AcrR family transcriptional regulator [Egibacteraceae bacterium]